MAARPIFLESIYHPKFIIGFNTATILQYHRECLIKQGWERLPINEAFDVDSPYKKFFFNDDLPYKTYQRVDDHTGAFTHVEFWFKRGG